ncbi:MAG: hypothetical protein PHI34_07120 [Acidobacteriota bacterium]|nr:hypothetical protein [Acidobacteriota bacterium]
MKTIILNTDSLLNPGDTAIFLARTLLLWKLLPGPSIALTSRTPDLDERSLGAALNGAAGQTKAGTARIGRIIVEAAGSR